VGWGARVGELLRLPPGQQVAAARAILDEAPEAIPERWNSRFAEGSLFEAWTRTTIARQAHAALADAAAPHLAGPGFHAVEIGAGNGALWAELLTPTSRGTLTVVDPVAEAVAQVAAVVPPGVELHPVVRPVQEVELPAADLVVCSMTLHHVAGRDAAERRRHGLAGPGKREVLEAIGGALAPRQGRGLLVEADIHCEVDRPPGDPQLREAIFDSYVRRCARSILEADLGGAPVSDDLRARWEALVRHWFLGQLEVAEVSVAERDVYELEVAGWLELVQRADLHVVGHRFVDDWRLFHLYELAAT